jgi:hypothetical protein
MRNWRMTRSTLAKAGGGTRLLSAWGSGDLEENGDEYHLPILVLAGTGAGPFIYKVGSAWLICESWSRLKPAAEELTRVLTGEPLWAIDGPSKNH